jgi:5-methylthioadenosine/S-adenosylhomocysteine deaminase
MKLLFKNIWVFDETDTSVLKKVSVATDGAHITYVGEHYDGKADRVIDGTGKLITAGFYNAHSHSAMSILRGWGEDLPLHRWLDERILPAEDRLTEDAVYTASLLSAAEMIAAGVVSFSDMYFFSEATARAALDSGMKANISRSIVSFDPASPPENDVRVAEALSLYDNYNGAGDGRIKVDFSLHAEYTNQENMCRYVAGLAMERGAAIQLHLSETEKEHLECIGRHGVTPAEFFRRSGVFDVPCTAAHCVWVSDSDIAVLKEYGVTAVHDPVSNLKLGSGVAPLRKLLDAGVNVALGTDGAASNNTQDILKELSFAAVLHKGVSCRADEVKSGELLPLLSRGGALSQGREDCGLIEAGRRADFAVIDMDRPHIVPVWNAAAALCSSVRSSDVVMTVCDGNILYENGEYTAIDIERLMHDFKRLSEHFFD